MLDKLNQHIDQVFQAKVDVVELPELELRFWLVDSAIENRMYSPEQVENIWGNMPYWAFAWSSGRALARYLLDHPELVKGKRVLDFGAGSGIVAIAAMKSGAKEAWACDIDELALVASEENAKLNDVALHTCTEIQQVEDIDLLVVGDVLYDPRNHQLAEQLFSQKKPVIWAESRAQTKLSQYGPVADYQAHTQPNLGGFDEHQNIHIYHHEI